MNNEKPKSQNEELKYKRLTIGELSKIFGVSRPTVRGYVKQVPGVGERLGHWYTSAQIKKIFDHHGLPVLVYYPALILGGMILMTHEMVYNTEMLIRRFFCYPNVLSFGAKTPPLKQCIESCFHLCNV